MGASMHFPDNLLLNLDFNYFKFLHEIKPARSGETTLPGLINIKNRGLNYGYPALSVGHR